MNKKRVFYLFAAYFNPITIFLFYSAFYIKMVPRNFYIFYFGSIIFAFLWLVISVDRKKRQYFFIFIYTLFTNYMLFFSNEFIRGIRWYYVGFPPWEYPANFFTTLFTTFLAYPSGWFSCFLLCFMTWLFNKKNTSVI